MTAPSDLSGGRIDDDGEPQLAIGLAKGGFQVCAAGRDGAVPCNRVLSRTRLTTLLAEPPACVAAMEACATAHHLGRMAQRRGHEVRLVPS